MGGYPRWAGWLFNPVGAKAISPPWAVSEHQVVVTDYHTFLRVCVPSLQIQQKAGDLHTGLPLPITHALALPGSLTIL